MQGFVGADAAWRRAMDSQQKFWEKSQSRDGEFVLRRDACRAIFDAQAAVAAAARGSRRLLEAEGVRARFGVPSVVTLRAQE